MIYAQRLTNQFISWGSRYYLMADFVLCFKTNSLKPATFTNSGFIVFPDEASLWQGLSTLAIYASSESQVTYDSETLTDLGKELKVGILGGPSDILTYRLVQRTSLGSVSSNGVPDASVGDGYGKCWVLTNSKAANTGNLSDPTIALTFVSRL